MVRVLCCFTATETVRTIRDEKPRTATSTFTQLLSSETASMIVFQVQCCFTSTDTTRTVRDGESGTATSTFTQLLSSGCGCAMDLRIVCRSMGAGHSS